jgi:predicted RND superfamily exporter protein
MNWITRFLLKRAGFICIVGFIIGGFGTFYSAHLFSNLRTELEELLPTNARSVLDLTEVRARMESTNNISVLVLSDHVAESKRFVVDLANAIAKFPPNTAAGVEYRIDNELRFFNDKKSLFVEQDDLEKMRRFIRDRIEYEKQLYNPLTIIENRTMVEPHLDFDAIEKKYMGRVSGYSRYPDGFYATPDEKIRVLLVNLPGGSVGIDGAKKLRKALDDAIAKLNPLSYSPDLQVHFAGGVQDLIEEHEALVEDLAKSTVIVCILVGVAMLVYFRTLVGTFALISSLLVGVLTTFGLSYFLVGYLNANSAFMGSIVIGNGINFGIILLARFVEEKQKHKGTPHSLAIAIQKTFSATIVAASAAGLSYGSLIFTSFRGFRQFGVIGLTGMVICWTASYTLIPAMIIVMYRMGFLHQKYHKSKAYIADSIAWIVEHFPKTIMFVTVVVTVLAAMTLPRISPDIIETDFTKLRNKHSLENGSLYWSKDVDKVFQHYLSPMVVLPKNQADVQPIADELKRMQKEDGDKGFITNVSTINDFVPTEQKKKIRTLNEIRELLPQRILARLSPKEQALSKDLLSPSSFHEFKQSDLPELVRSKFREQDGTIGKLVLVEPSLSPELQKSDNLIHLVAEVRAAADKVRPGTAVAGSFPVTSDLFESIVKDGPKATITSFCAVFLLLVVIFRNVRLVAECSFGLLLGVLWLSGYILGFHHKINFLNFIALPITFGIGVDYGVNVFQRYRLERADGILHVLRQTGGAVMLASFTTVIGYASLIMASNQAFVSFGQLAILGEITCVFAAVVSLPAFLWYLEQRKDKGKKSQPDNATRTEPNPPPSPKNSSASPGETLSH